MSAHPEDGAHVEHRVEAYVDGTLDGDGAIALARALRAGGDEGARVREHLAFAGLLGQALDGAGAEAFARSVDERIDAQGKATAFVRAVDRSLPKRARARRQDSRLPALAAAAVLLIAIGCGWLATRTAAPARVVEECRIVLAGDAATIARAGALISAVSGTSLIAGDEVRTRGDSAFRDESSVDGAPSGVSIRYDDGTRIDLGAGAHVQVLAGDAGKRLRLESGWLGAEVAAQPTGRPFMLLTGNASIEVVGTRFSLTAASARTRLDLSHGEVRLSRTSDGRCIAVHAGETASVAADEPFAAIPRASARPGVEPPAVPGSAAPAMGPWQALFPATGLADWTQQHGVWTNDGGVIAGVGGKGKAARLLGERDLLDLELTCRMRISGVDHAELQVGTYDWFFDIPAGAGGWRDVTLTQRGGDLRCTVDGTAVERQAGDGVPARAGALAFYVMPTGRLEISDAQIRVPLAGAP